MSSVLRKLSSLRSTAPPEEKFIKKGAGSRFIISYDTEVVEKSPGPGNPPYHYYSVWLKLSYADGRRERNYRTEIANGTMTQRVESIVSDAARNAIRKRIPMLLEIFKKYGASYQLDEKTKKLLQADAHFIKLEGT